MNNTFDQEYDAIVVGTGPGGATVAKELSQKKKKVLILERGSYKPIRGTALQAATTLIPFRNILFTGKMVAMIRATITGGSSIVYCATAFDPPMNMLKSYGVDISEEVKEIRKELPIAPLKDELVGPMANRIMDSAQDLDYDWQKLDKFVYQDKCRLDCDKCTWGCPYEAKWTGRNYIDEAIENGAVLINGALVKKVITSNNRAEGVEFKKNGKTHKAYAPLTIISGGGIGTPVLLRASGIKKAGYDFFYDPLIIVNGTAKDFKGVKEFPMAAGVHMEEDGYMMTDLRYPNVVHMLSSAEVFRFHKVFSQPRTLSIMVKAKDSLGGRLTDSGGVRKPLTVSDKKKLMHGYDRAKKILENAGAKGVFKCWYIAAHPGGTAKINDIVDSDLKTEYDNLYVCDCSVIPEAWGLPPTFTLIGLGKRLAKHLTAGKKADSKKKAKKA